MATLHDDSRIRVYDGYTLACKYKGHKNNNSQIRASFSPVELYKLVRI